MTVEFPEGEVLVIIEQQAIYDSAPIPAYQQATRAQMLRRGGSVAARGAVLVEGDPAPASQLILRWPSAQAFLDWQQSDEYRPWKEARAGFMKTRITILSAV